MAQFPFSRGSRPPRQPALPGRASPCTEHMRYGQPGVPSSPPPWRKARRIARKRGKPFLTHGRQRAAHQRRAHVMAVTARSPGTAKKKHLPSRSVFCIFLLHAQPCQDLHLEPLDEFRISSTHRVLWRLYAQASSIAPSLASGLVRVHAAHRVVLGSLPLGHLESQTSEASALVQ